MEGYSRPLLIISTKKKGKAPRGRDIRMKMRESNGERSKRKAQRAGLRWGVARATELPLTFSFLYPSPEFKSRRKYFRDVSIFRNLYKGVWKNDNVYFFFSFLEIPILKNQLITLFLLLITHLQVYNIFVLGVAEKQVISDLEKAVRNLPYPCRSGNTYAWANEIITLKNPSQP